MNEHDAARGRASSVARCAVRWTGCTGLRSPSTTSPAGPAGSGAAAGGRVAGVGVAAVAAVAVPLACLVSGPGGSTAPTQAPVLTAAPPAAGADWPVPLGAGRLDRTATLDRASRRPTVARRTAVLARSRRLRRVPADARPVGPSVRRSSDRQRSDGYRRGADAGRRGDAVAPGDGEALDARRRPAERPPHPTTGPAPRRPGVRATTATALAAQWRRHRRHQARSRSGAPTARATRARRSTPAGRGRRDDRRAAVDASGAADPRAVADPTAGPASATCSTDGDPCSHLRRPRALDDVQTACGAGLRAGLARRTVSRRTRLLARGRPSTPTGSAPPSRADPGRGDRRADARAGTCRRSRRRTPRAGRHPVLGGRQRTWLVRRSRQGRRRGRRARLGLRRDRMELAPPAGEGAELAPCVPPRGWSAEAGTLTPARW